MAEEEDAKGDGRAVRIEGDEQYVALNDDGGGAPPKEPEKWNYNVVLTLVVTAVSGMGDSIWSSTALAAYLYIINDDNNAKVGYVEAAQGLATLATALPVGYLADKYGRGLAAALGGVCFLVADAATTYAVWSEQQDPNNVDHAYILMIVAMVLWGCGGGVVSGPIQALYADSIPTGDRSKYYLYLTVAWLLASTIGPLITIVIFQTMSNDWTLSELRAVIYIGMAFEVLVAAMMFFFRDSKSLGRESEHISLSGDIEQDAGSDVEEDELAKDGDLGAAWAAAEGDNGSSRSRRLSGEEQLKRRQRAAERIPYLTFFAGLVTALGSGMTVKFFPLFFKNDCGMSPTGVQVIYVLVPITIALFSGLGQRLAAAGFGRVQTIMLCKVLGVSALLSMVGLIQYRGRWYIILPLYLFRTGIMNSTYPLEESILMDYVPKATRARWKSLESIAQFGWCGSAALGGILADKFDYGFTFGITAAVQGSALFVWAFLLPIIPRVEQRVEKTRPVASASSVNDPAGGAGDLQEPLLESG